MGKYRNYGNKALANFTVDVVPWATVGKSTRPTTQNPFAVATDRSHTTPYPRDFPDNPNDWEGTGNVNDYHVWSDENSAAVSSATCFCAVMSVLIALRLL